jgi:hypothetical protein
MKEWQKRLLKSTIVWTVFILMQVYVFKFQNYIIVMFLGAFCENISRAWQGVIEPKREASE